MEDCFLCCETPLPVVIALLALLAALAIYCLKVKRTAENSRRELDKLLSKVSELKGRHDLVTTNIAASVLIRSVDDKIEFVSPYTQVLTGYSIEEVYSWPGDFLEDIALEQDRERYRRARHVSKLGEDILVRFRVRHQCGLILWLETRLVPVCDDEGNLLSVMGVTIDVTDTLNYQRQIEEQNRDLNDFAYMVSHDLKAPIFTIKGMASALMEDFGDTLGDSGKGLLSYILDGADRLEKLVASVIEYSSIATKETSVADVDLNVVLSNVQSDMHELIRQKDALVNISERLPTVRGNQVRIYQVFSNLVGNALKYSSPQRRPEITVHTASIQPAYARIEVRDNGVGIPGDKLDDIFRPYRRAHSGTVEGSGIGLACVKKIMDQLGGKVSVSSTVEQGSIFFVDFPTPHPKPQSVPSELARFFE